ncbi:MAG: hypothetical protein HZB16_17355 [Armatimonadetes bacterium]|nr:hypothetical protein [Armatimonadota bacterium]
MVGHRAEGTSTDTLWNQGAWINASAAEATEDLSATRLYAKVTAVAGWYKAAIYAVAGGGLLAQTAAARAPADGWLELALATPVALKAGQRYWLAIWSDDASAKVFCDQGGLTRWLRRDWGEWPNPVALVEGGAVTYCLYAAGATLPPADAQPPVKPSERILAGHTVQLDAQGKIIPWDTPVAKAYDQFLRRRWQFIKTKVPPAPGPAPRSDYPQYFFYDGYTTKDLDIRPDNWMNDVGEKIPNWFESARLYYAYTGDAEPLAIVRRMIDYSLDHGTSPAGFAWPRFPYTTTNYGDTEFRGFHGPFALHETHTDHAGDMGLSYYRLYQLTGDARYLRAALAVADALAAHVRTGSETESVWPYRVRMDTGQITAQYCANWAGAVGLLEALVAAGQGNTAAYVAARDKAREFVLRFPMANGRWVDGHTDNAVTGNSNRSNMSKSNTMLYLFDHPEFDPDWRTHIPRYLKWTEDLFVTRTNDGEPATSFGANVVGEQDGFNYKMDYQTARYAAECARWYRASGDESYREKAYRSLNWVTYCSDAEGRATESPYSLHIATWWSDCYGECPRMFYHAFAAMPEWAPPGEDHILYSAGVLADVAYAPGEVRYTARDAVGTEYLRLTFLPATVTLDGAPLQRSGTDGWQARDLGGGDYALTVRHARAGQVRLAR